MATESGMDKNALADNVQRTVERTALHKVRKLVDNLETEEVDKHRLEKRALIIAVVVVTVCAVWFVLGTIANDQKYERGQQIQLPDKVVVPQKN